MTPSTVPWNERWRAWRQEYPGKIRSAGVNVARAFELVWQGHPASLIAMVICTLIGAGIPAGQAYVAKLIVDGVVAGSQAHVDAMAGFQSVLPWLLLELGLVIVVAEARELPGPHVDTPEHLAAVRRLMG